MLLHDLKEYDFEFLYFVMDILQFLSNIKNMKSERFNNFLLKINRKFVWHTAYLYRIDHII